jgi:hypothetical protein
LNKEDCEYDNIKRTEEQFEKDTKEYLADSISNYPLDFDTVLEYLITLNDFY